jgi:dTDP-4-dehydrorhamnose 3,5-epimerase
MKLTPTPIHGAVLIEPRVFADSRGFFLESFNERRLAEVGVTGPFVQDNHSRSEKNVLRGLHYQIGQPQGKLVRVVSGEVFDVAVDLRVGSPSFAKWFGVRLSEADHRMFWIPPGCAHGFLVLSERADFLYKATDYYAPEQERTLAWNDPELRIEWPLVGEPVVSAKDAAGRALREAEVYVNGLGLGVKADGWFAARG